MARPIYTPNKKLKRGYTQGAEYILSTTKEEYIGPYYIYPNQKIYTGTSPSTTSVELEVFTTPYNDPNTTRYAELTAIQFNNHTAPRYYYPSPSADDYTKGYIERYFVQKINEPNLIREVTQDAASNVNKDNRPGINKQLYRVLRLKWLITGNPENVRKTHNRILQLRESQMPGISNYLTDRIEFLR